LDPRRVVIVGGTAVVSEDMEAAIVTLLPNATVERIGGANRYETNVLFSEAVFPVEGWASIPPAAFTAQSPDVHDAWIGSTSASNASDAFLLAPIQLPHGAEILELQASGFDSDAGQTLFVTMYRVPNNGGSLQQIAGLSSAGATGDFTVSSTSIGAGWESVDNQNHSYVITILNVDGNPYLRNVMVRYRLGAP
jgi:hypothetical protein